MIRSSGKNTALEKEGDEDVILIIRHKEPIPIDGRASAASHLPMKTVGNDSISVASALVKKPASAAKICRWIPRTNAVLFTPSGLMRAMAHPFDSRICANLAKL